MKKILSAFIAAAAITSMFTCTVFADVEPDSEEVSAVQYSEDGTPTFCFDNSEKLSLWELDGSVTETNFNMSITSDKKESGNGSLALSENVSGEIKEAYGGAYVKASSFGLKNFDGYTMTISYLFDDNVSVDVENFSIYTNGNVWINNTISNNGSRDWQIATITVPNKAGNTMFGFTIPTFKETKGTIVYIDNITITDAEGKMLANVGDFKEAEGAKEIKTVSTGVNVVLIILLVILIFGVIGGIGYMVLSFMKKFR